MDLGFADLPAPQPSLPFPQMPLVPLTPALSILLNICLMLKLNYMTWLRFSVWLLIGECQPGRGPRWAAGGGQGGQRAGTFPLRLVQPLQDLWYISAMASGTARRTSKSCSGQPPHATWCSPMAAWRRQCKPCSPPARHWSSSPAAQSSLPVHEDSWGSAHPLLPPQEARGAGSPLCLRKLMFVGLHMLEGPQDFRT